VARRVGRDPFVPAVIGKIIKGKGFGGAVRYAMQKDLGEARLIATNLVADRNDADALAACRTEVPFERENGYRAEMHVDFGRY
ncbi:MAG: hypothetical protein ACREDL_17405, partial [Bradyrhizobium sp.]